MKYVVAILVFITAFVGGGVLMHSSLYDKTGIFVWSFQDSGGAGGKTLVRTTLEPLPIELATDSKALRADEETESEKAQPQAQEPAAADADSPAQEGREAGQTGLSLFNGKDLGQWEKTRFGGEGDVEVNEEGYLEFGFGAIMTGVHWTGDIPATSGYELSLEAMKLDGNDFFCAVTFPVKDSFASFIIGGWGGGIVGISSVDDLDASENETMNIDGFADDQWYRVRVVVTDDRLQAWIDQRKMVDLELEGRKISLRPGDIELSAPLGIASYMTRAQYRNIEWKTLDVGGGEPQP